MTIRREPDLWCDRQLAGCIGWYQRNEPWVNARTVRQQARRHGWTRNAGADWCPVCSKGTP